MGYFSQDSHEIVNLSVPVIAVTALCAARIWILVVRYRGIQRLLKWQQILMRQSGPPTSLKQTPERTIASFVGTLMPDLLKRDYNFTLNLHSKLRMYHPLLGFGLDSAEGLRLTLVLWGQVLYFFLFAMIFVAAMFHREGLYSSCQQRSSQEACEATVPSGGVGDWLALCEWRASSGCSHSFYFHAQDPALQRRAMAIVVVVSLCATTASVVLTQLVLQHPARCVAMAYHVNFATTAERPLDAAPATAESLGVNPVVHTDLRVKGNVADFNDELRGACGDRRPALSPLPPTQRRLLKLNRDNTLLPLPLGEARRRIFFLAARHRQLREKYDELPTGRLLTSLLLAPPTVTPFPQRPLTQVSDVWHCWNWLRTTGDVFLNARYLQQSAFNPRALQALFETCRHFHTETIYRKLRGAQDMAQDLHYLCQHLPAPFSPEALMVANSSSLVQQTRGGFDRDLFLMKMFLALWAPGLQAQLLFQTLLEEEAEMLYYVDDALRASLAFERVWQRCVLKPLLWLYRVCLRPDNAELTRHEAARAAFRTTRVQYSAVLLALYLVVLPGGLLYLFYAMSAADGRLAPGGLRDLDATRASLLFLWQCVCLVSLAQYYCLILPLRVLLADVLLPRVWLAADFRELHRVVSARLPYVLRRRGLIVLGAVEPNRPRFLPNDGPIRETGSYLQAFHPVCRVCRQTDVLRAFPVAHFFLALGDRDLSVPSHFRPVLEVLQRKQQKNQPKHVELKRLENSTRVVEDQLARQSALVYDCVALALRDLRAMVAAAARGCYGACVLAVGLCWQQLLLQCNERQVRVCVYDVALTVLVLGYLQLAVLAFALQFPHVWALGLVWVYAPIWGLLLFGVVLPQTYAAWRAFWDRGYEDLLSGQERARRRHRAQLRRAHVKESRMVGIDLLGDLPDVVEVTEQEVAEEEYLRDKAKRLGKPLYAVRKKPAAFVHVRSKIKYVNNSAQMQQEKAAKWRQAWEHGHLNRALGLVGLSVFVLMPFPKYPVASARVAVKASNDIPRVDFQQPRDEDEESGQLPNDGEFKRGAEASLMRGSLQTAENYRPPDYGEFSDIDEDSMA